MTETAIQPATGELQALAAAMRPDWDRDQLAQAILAAKNAGWTFEQVFRYVVRLLVREDAAPAELRHAAANPLRPEAAKTPAWHDRAAEARERLLHRHDDEPGEVA
jgi:hypothetical protein